MKILYLAMESANWVINLCNEFVKYGHEVTCVVQHVDDYEKDRTINNIPGLTIISMTNEEFNSEKAIKEKILDKLPHDFDVVIGSHSPICPLAAYIGQNIKKPWGIMLLDIPTDLILNQEWRRKNWELWFNVLIHADQVIFNTFVARDEYYKFTNKYYGDENVVIYGTNMPKEYKLRGLNNNFNYMTTACRFAELKNCALLPRAYQYTKKIVNSYIGIGRDNGDLNNVINECNKYGLMFENYNEISENNKLEIISNASFMVYPQKTEYIGGLSPFEAMYVGTPVLVPDLKVLRDLYGEHAIYFTNNDPKDLARVIDNVTNNPPSKEWLIAASDYAETVATYTTMAKGLLEIFERMRK